MASNGDGARVTIVLIFETFLCVHNEFVLNEVAVIDVHTGRYDSVLFTPPYEQTWVHRNS